MATKAAIALEKELKATPKAYSYIRFSTPEQEKGDSLSRQIEARDKYIKERGLLLSFEF